MYGITLNDPNAKCKPIQMDFIKMKGYMKKDEEGNVEKFLKSCREFK